MTNPTDKESVAALVIAARNYASMGDGVPKQAIRYIALLCEAAERALSPAQGDEMRDARVTDAMVTRACVALAEFKTNLVGMEGQRKATTETIVRVVLKTALASHPFPQPGMTDAALELCAAVEQLDLNTATSTNAPFTWSRVASASDAIKRAAAVDRPASQRQR